MSVNSGRRRRTWTPGGDPVIDNARLLARNDEDRFTENFLNIKTKDAQIKKLVYNEGQRTVSRILRALTIDLRPIRVFVIKSRQVGMSTYGASKIFTKSYGRDNVEGLIIAHEKKRASKLLAMSHLFYQQLPDAMKIPLVRSGSTALQYAGTNSGVEVITGGNADSARGSTPLIVHASELPYYADLFGQMNAVENAVPFIPGSMIFAEGTANGAGTDGHQFWEQCGKVEFDRYGDLILKPGENAYFQIFLPWFDDPENRLPPFPNMQAQANFIEMMFREFPDLEGRMEHYDLDILQIGWYYMKLKFQCFSDEIKAMAEYPCDAQEAWVAGGKPIFPPNILGKYRNSTRDGKLYEPVKDFNRLQELAENDYLERYGEHSDKYIEIWVPPTHHDRYVIGADVAAGFMDGDFSAAFVINRKTLNICAEIHGRFEPDEFAHVLGSMGRVYNNAIIAPEVTGIGMSVLASLQKFYWNIYHSRVVDNYGMKITNRLGWDTNHSTRPMMIAEAKRVFRDIARHPELMGPFLPSKALIDELRTFTVAHVTGKPEAASGCYDDRVMAWAIALICAIQEEYGSIGGDARSEMPGSSKTREQNLPPRMEDVMDNILNGNW